MSSIFHARKGDLNRRQLFQNAVTGVFVSAGLVACSPSKLTFENTDLTGAPYAKDFLLKDHEGKIRRLADFRGKIVVIFFGYIQCPDVCPTTLSTMSEVKKLLGNQADLLQVLFITIDPARDQIPILSAYMKSFDGTFLALRPEPDSLGELAEHFKIYYRRVDGKTPNSYAMDHSAGKYIFDQKGNIRLFSAYGTEAKIIANDIEKLIKYK